MSCPLSVLSAVSQQKPKLDSSKHDARTKETAATLLGVSYTGPTKPPAPPPTKLSEIPETRHSLDGRGKVPTAMLDHPSSSAQPQPPPAVAPRQPPQPPTYSASAAVPPPTYHNFHHQQTAYQSIRPHQHVEVPPPQVNPPPPAQTAVHHHPAPPPPADSATTALSMSSIGFGIDSSQNASWGDATEAAVRALQDAMERSTLRLPMTMPSQHLLQIKVQLGVPSKQLGSNEPMTVDVSRLTTILPQAIPVLPIRVVVGGLYISGETQGSPSICTAVACVTLQSMAALTIPETSVAARNHSGIPTNGHPHSSPWASLGGHQPHPPATASAPGPEVSSAVLSQASAVPPPTVTTVAPTPQNGTSAAAVRQAVTAPSAPPTAAPLSASKNVHRSSSIEMLAMISEEIRVAGDKNSQKPAQNSTFTPIAEGQATLAAQQRFSEGGEYIAFPGMNGFDPSMEYGEDGQFRNGSYNYKKLPPGVTTKNNRRLFVKHTYRDHSVEAPLPEEADLVGVAGASSARTPNAAFPLKLHETLTQIENNGHADIIGWMPHGRSFKIHKQKEFAEIILPRYFVMTKKSSFLRQLNLYGFNRFSAGLDQGSYYHEKFLRGMKFLCRRMTRQKVNGNRIRSAGNPDEEPSLAAFPSCPPPSLGALAIAPAATPTPTAIAPAVTSPSSSSSSANGAVYSPPREGAGDSMDEEQGSENNEENYDDDKSDDNVQVGFAGV